MSRGISNAGKDAESEFQRHTGFDRADKAAAGDFRVTVDAIASYVEVKEATSSTLNQVRAVKFIPMVVWDKHNDQWFVVDPITLVSIAATKGRGQHTEVPFECMTVSTKNIKTLACKPEALRDRVHDAIRLGERHAELKQLMQTLLTALNTLSDKCKSDVVAYLSKHRHSQ